MRIANFALVSSLFLFASRIFSSPAPEPSFSADPMARASEIYQSIVARLDDAYPDLKGSVWSEGSIALEPKWIVQSPEGLWGKPASELPGNFSCDPHDKNCDKAFSRMHCERESDCGVPSTHCAPLEASVWKIGQIPTKMCLGPADHVIDDMYKVMVSAEHELDFVSLAMPTGEFYTAFINALSVLSQKPSVPNVRLLFGGKTPTSLNLLVTTDKVLDSVVDDIRALQLDTYNRLAINLAWLSDGKSISWNHAKIVVADGKYALTGGHNLWGDIYLTATPLFDLSLIYRGEAATGARNFVNALWSHVASRWSSFPANLGRLDDFRLTADEAGPRNTISVGRLGAFGDNPSDDALRALIDSAESKLYISQQDLYNQIRTGATQSFAFDNIIAAAARGVEVKIIQSNKFPIGGFGSVKGASAYRGFLDALVDKLVKERGLGFRDAQARACQSISYASFRFSAWVSPWPKNGDPIGNHTKFVMVDDSAFYIGSHNLYLANLQEFGTMVADVDAASQLKAEYWDKVWAQSSPEAYACPY